MPINKNHILKLIEHNALSAREVAEVYNYPEISVRRFLDKMEFTGLVVVERKRVPKVYQLKSGVEPSLNNLTYPVVPEDQLTGEQLVKTLQTWLNLIDSEKDTDEQYVSQHGLLTGLVLVLMAGPEAIGRQDYYDNSQRLIDWFFKEYGRVFRTWRIMQAVAELPARDRDYKYYGLALTDEQKRKLVTLWDALKGEIFKREQGGEIK